MTDYISPDRHLLSLLGVEGEDVEGAIPLQRPVHVPQHRPTAVRRGGGGGDAVVCVHRGLQHRGSFLQMHLCADIEEDKKR